MKLFKNRKNRLKSFKITRLEDMTIMVIFNTKGGETAKLYLSSSDDKDMFYEQIVKAINIINTNRSMSNTCDLLFDNIEVTLTRKDIYMIAEKAMGFPRFYSKEVCIYDRMIDNSVYTVYADDFGLRFDVLSSMNENMEYGEEYEFTFTGLANMKNMFSELISSYEATGEYKSISENIEVETNVETDNMNGVNLKNLEPKTEIVHIVVDAYYDGSVYIEEVFPDKAVYLFRGNIYDIKKIISSIEEIEDELRGE